MSTTGQAGGRRSGSLPSYSEIAQKEGVRLCEGGCHWNKGRHQLGLLTQVFGPWTIHWGPRRSTRRGIRRFLILCALMYPEAREGPLWARLYHMNSIARRLALHYRITFPREFSTMDRARALNHLKRTKARGDLARKVRRWA